SPGSPGLTGRSSIPEMAVLEPMSRGVLDHPLSRVMTVENDADRLSQAFAFPRHDLPEFCVRLAPSQIRGRRECRVKASPMARLQTKKQAAVTTGSAKSSGIPCAMVLQLICDLPGEPGFLAPIAAPEVISATCRQRRGDRTT